MIDGDDTYPAENAKEMCDLVLYKNSDMVIGDRLSSTYFQENKRPFHNLGNTMVRAAVNSLFKGNITDIMTGYRAFSPLFVKSFPVLSKGFEIETEMSIFALDKNMQLDTIPVQYRDRPDGSVSKLNTYSDGFKVILTIIKLFKDYKPLSFFGICSFLFFALGLGFFIPVFIEYLSTGLVLRFPTLFASIAVMIVAILLLICGFILDTVVKTNRKDFEARLNMIQMMLHANRAYSADGEDE